MNFIIIYIEKIRKNELTIKYSCNVDKYSAFSRAKSRSVCNFSIIGGHSFISWDPDFLSLSAIKLKNIKTNCHHRFGRVSNFILGTALSYNFSSQIFLLHMENEFSKWKTLLWKFVFSISKWFFFFFQKRLKRTILCCY